MRQVRHIFGNGVWLAGAIGSLGLTACSSEPSVGPPTQVGQSDRPGTKLLQVDEAGITGQVEGRVLKVKVPISTADRQASRYSGVSVVEVGGKRTLAAQRARSASAFTWADSR